MNNSLVTLDANFLTSVLSFRDKPTMKRIKEESDVSTMKKIKEESGASTVIASSGSQNSKVQLQPIPSRLVK